MCIDPGVNHTVTFTTSDINAVEVAINGGPASYTTTANGNDSYTIVVAGADIKCPGPLTIIGPGTPGVNLSIKVCC